MNEKQYKIIVLLACLFIIMMVSTANAGNPYIQIQPPQIMTPYELRGIDSYEQRHRENEARYERQMYEMQRYQQAQEAIEQLEELTKAIEER